MKKMSDMAEEKNKTTDISSALNETSWSDEHMPAWMKDNVVVKHLDGPLFFGFASAFQQRVSQLSNIQYVIIRMERVPFIDQTGLYALEESILSLEEKGIDVLLTGLQEQPEDMLRKINLIPGLIVDEHLFKNFNNCVTWLKDKVFD
jgi:SulP family sulfate permease